MTDFQQPFDLVRSWAEDAPNQFAIINPGAKLTTSQLVTMASQLGQVMRRMGVASGDIIGVSLSAVPRIVFAVAASHEAAVMVPLVNTMLTDNYVGMKWIAVEKLNPNFPAENQIVLDAQMFSRLRSVKVTAAPRAYDSPDSLFRIAMSSGTTGRPKAIPLTVQQSIDRGIESVERWAKGGRFMSLMPASNGVGWHAWTTSLVRRTAYLVPSTDSRTNLKIIAAAGVESIMGAPGQLANLAMAIRVSGTVLPKLKHIQSGGSRVTKSLAHELFRLTGLEVGNTYSSTEVGGTAYRSGSSDDPSYMGQLLPITEIEIVDPETHTPLPEGEYGLVRVRRPDMVTHYFNNPEATAEQFKDGWFYPGDIGAIKDNGLYLGARETEMINAGGLKVDPTVIDNFMLAEPEILDAATFAVRDSFEIDRVGVAFVPAPGFTEEEISSAIDRAINKKAPVTKYAVEEIPRNEWGKPLRKELTERFSEIPISEE